jgi:hypothetical protein
MLVIFTRRLLCNEIEREVRCCISSFAKNWCRWLYNVINNWIYHKGILCLITGELQSDTGQRVQYGVGAL